MNYEDILKLLKRNKIDSIDALVACACDAAWKQESKSIQKKNPKYTFEDFCSDVNEMWLDCDDDTGITRIADWVAEYMEEHKESPESFWELYDAIN
jgi:hypothetical protein